MSTIQLKDCGTFETHIPNIVTWDYSGTNAIQAFDTDRAYWVPISSIAYITTTPKLPEESDGRD